MRCVSPYLKSVPVTKAYALLSEVCTPVSEACTFMSEVYVPVSEVCLAFPQEEMALELINCPDYKLRPHQHSYLRSTIILVLSLLMVPRGPWGLDAHPCSPTLRPPTSLPSADLPHDWHGACAGGLPCAGSCPLQQLGLALFGEPGDHSRGGDWGPGALPDYCRHDQGEDGAAGQQGSLWPR